MRRRRNPSGGPSLLLIGAAAAAAFVGYRALKGSTASAPASFGSSGGASGGTSTSTPSASAPPAIPSNLFDTLDNAYFAYQQNEGTPPNTRASWITAVQRYGLNWPAPVLGYIWDQTQGFAANARRQGTPALPSESQLEQYAMTAWANYGGVK